MSCMAFSTMRPYSDKSSGIFGRIVSAPTVSTIIGQMKRWVSKQIGFSIWQKSFHDHIIRNRAEYRQIWKYIDENPLKWELDCYYNHSAD